MALDALVPIWSTRLTLVGGRRLLVAPRHPEIAWLDASPESLADHFGRVTRESWSREGELLPWLDVAPLSLTTESLSLSLKPPKESTLPDPLTLRFDVVLGEGASGQWMGFIPALAVGASGIDAEQVRTNLQSTARLEFLRSRRLLDARQVLSVQWYTEAELAQSEAHATFYTFSELRAFREADQEQRLPKIATVLRPSLQRVFEVDRALAELEQAVSSPFSRTILLIGPSGAGKSALVEELARRAPEALSGRQIWETSAARMERVLTESSGWQDNLSQVCTELTKQNDWLYVRNLAELYEVGRYVGNTTSMGEYLRPRLAGGDLSFISECTPEQVAHIEARYPGSLDSFRRITIAEPDPEALVRICQARAQAESGSGTVEAAAVDELIRLQRRFSPYSGFPGRPVRFLESLALTLRGGSSPLDREAMLGRFCDETGMPRALIDPHHELPAEEVEASFAGQVFGQPAAISAVVEGLVSIRAGLSRPKRPISTLLFVGPTGVGKTETAKALASYMFGSRDRLLRLDMSEYATPAAAIRLTEGPDGDGRLTAAIRREPFSVVLFDEIEKAHPMVFDLLLQVLGEGRLSDGRGRVADFCSSIIILTSNIGATEASVAPSGFARGGDRRRALLEVYRAAAERHFRPEFYNRLDRVVAFAPLGPAAIARVLDRELLALEQRPGMRMRRASLAISEAARSHLAAVGYSPTWGARHLQRALRTEVSAPIAAAMNGSPSPHAIDLQLDLDGGRVVCHLTERAPGKRALSAR
ncbi:MAG: ATP-dependent Clp protease ATP-binding subunit ClpA, partial [Myxococcota bacterium]